MRFLRLFPRLLRDLPSKVGLVVVVFSFLLCAVLFFAGFPSRLNGSLFGLPVALAAWIFKRHGGLICLGATFLVLVIGNTIAMRAMLWPLFLDIAFTTGVLVLFVEVFIIGYLRQALDLSDAARSKIQHAEQQLLRVYEHERRINQLKDEFLLNVNHELRTPLTEIHGYLELLREYRSQLPANTQAVFLENALHGCEELMQLINNVLDTVQVDADLKAPVITTIVLAEELRAVLSGLDAHCRAAYTFHVDVPETLLVQADVQYFHCVSRNLLSNIFKYVPAHTSVYITAEPHKSEKQNGPRSSNPTHVCLSVKDEGPGIPPDDVPWVFNKFMRLQRDVSGSVRGSGLGLYIAKQMVEIQGGNIWVESSGVPGEGTLFCFTLPVGSFASFSSYSSLRV